MNYLLGLSFLKRNINDLIPKTVLEIYFGTLGEILGKSNLIDFKYINLDLPPLFLMSEEYLKKCFGKRRFLQPAENLHGEIKIEEMPKFTFLPNWRVEDLTGEIDLFVNFISFQEMEPHIVHNYAKKVIELSPKFILLRNLREGSRRRLKKYRCARSNFWGRLSVIL